jgi:ubiquinone/menaquinone biosynthesis C-methylase UbiE
VTSRPPPAYAVGQFRSPEEEIARLGRQAAVLAAAEEEIFRSLGLPEEGRVLDVGCGPGFVGARIAGARPGLRVVGVDRDETVLAQARTRIEVVRGEAEALPFAGQAFDGVYSRLLLRHLRRPDAALADMHRVLRPGGIAIVLDSDDGALVMDPVPPPFAAALAARQETFRRRGADPRIGRRLPALLRRAAFIDVAVRTLVVDSSSIGRAAFGQIVLAPVADAIDGELLGRTQVDEATSSIRAWQDDEDAFGMTTVLVVAGGRGG